MSTDIVAATRPWRFSLTEGDGQEHGIPDRVKRDFTADAPGRVLCGQGEAPPAPAAPGPWGLPAESPGPHVLRSAAGRHAFGRDAAICANGRAGT